MIVSLGIIFLATAGALLVVADAAVLAAADAAAVGAPDPAGLAVFEVLPQATKARLAATPSTSNLRP
jgi:hypothetical protein